MRQRPRQTRRNIFWLAEKMCVLEFSGGSEVWRSFPINRSTIKILARKRQLWRVAYCFPSLRVIKIVLKVMESTGFIRKNWLLSVKVISISEDWIINNSKYDWIPIDVLIFIVYGTLLSLLEYFTTFLDHFIIVF